MLVGTVHPSSSVSSYTTMNISHCICDGLYVHVTSNARSFSLVVTVKSPTGTGAENVWHFVSVKSHIASYSSLFSMATTNARAKLIR